MVSREESNKKKRESGGGGGGGMGSWICGIDHECGSV